MMAIKDLVEVETVSGIFAVALIRDQDKYLARYWQVKADEAAQGDMTSRALGQRHHPDQDGALSLAVTAIENLGGPVLRVTRQAGKPSQG